MKKIAIFGQIYKREDEKYLLNLIKILTKKGISIFINKEFNDSIKKEGRNITNDLTIYTEDSPLKQSFDALITMGGDGTILRAFNQIKELETPILGINLGQLGFLANIQKNEIEKAIDSLLGNEYSIGDRLVLKITIDQKGAKNKLLGFTLNELAIIKKDTNSMIGIETFLNKEYLTTYFADGLIISTPTGSTAYSLSCQGPIMMPNSHSFLITPVAPHNLNARPFVIEENFNIKLRVLTKENKFLASLDSRVTILDTDTTISITKAKFTAKIILLKNHTFISTLKKKLLWGYDIRNRYNQ